MSILCYSILPTIQKRKNGTYLSHNGGEQAVVIHPAIHTGSCQVRHVEKVYLGEGAATGVEGSDDTSRALSLNPVGWRFSEDIRAEGPSGIIQDMSPAAMTRNGGSEVLQQYMTGCYPNKS